MPSRSGGSGRPVVGLEDVAIHAARITGAVEQVIEGKSEAVRLAVTVLLAEGHLLIEDVPGVGKTTLAHAMAQAIGGRYGLPHGTLNAICLPPALRFNAEFVPEPLLNGRAADRAEELARLSGFTTLGALGVPQRDLPELAATAAARPGARANPRPASPADVLELLSSVF